MTAGFLAALPWPAMMLALPYGLAVGVAYLLATRLNARLYLENGPLWPAIGLMLVRLLGSVALLAAPVPWGWAPTLAGLLGFALARLLVIGRGERGRRGVGGEPGFSQSSGYPGFFDACGTSGHCGHSAAGGDSSDSCGSGDGG